MVHDLFTMHTIRSSYIKPYPFTTKSAIEVIYW